MTRAPDEAGPAGRHAAADRPGGRTRRRSWADPEPPPRRRHAAPDDSPYGVPTRPRTASPTTARSSATASAVPPDPAPPTPNGPGHHGPEPGPNGSPPSGAHGLGYQGPEPSPDGHARRGANGLGYHGPEPSPGRLRRAGCERGRLRPAGSRAPTATRRRVRTGPATTWAGPSPNGYTTPSADGYPAPGADGVGYQRPGPSPDGDPAPGADGVGYHRPGPSPDGYPAPADGYPAPGADGVGYHRRGRAPTGQPGARCERLCGARCWRDRVPAGRAGGAPVRRGRGGAASVAGGQRLPPGDPGAAGGQRLPAGRAGRPGHRLPVHRSPVDPDRIPRRRPRRRRGRARRRRLAGERERDRLADRRPPERLARPLDPQIAAVPLEDEATEVLDRPGPKPAAGKPQKPPHPPRAVVRRRRARRKALEWPLLIVFAMSPRSSSASTSYRPSTSRRARCTRPCIEGDRVLVNKVGYHLHDVHRGDVVVFSRPPNLDVSEDDLIKRVVALPGETVEGRGGKVYVNGAPLDEPYVEPLCHGTGAFSAVTVPAGKLWVMGDNRCNSSDSRVFGPIDENLVVGRAFVLVWPFDRLPGSRSGSRASARFLSHPRASVVGVTEVVEQTARAARAGSLSPSRAADFKTCPLLYRFRTIDRLPEQPTADQARGTLVHAVLERLFDLPAAERTRERGGRPGRARSGSGCSRREPDLAELFADEAGRDELAWTSAPRTARRLLRGGGPAPARAGRAGDAGRGGCVDDGAAASAATSTGSTSPPTGDAAGGRLQDRRRAAGGVRGAGAVPAEVLRAGAVAHPRRGAAAAAADLPQGRRGPATTAPTPRSWRGSSAPWSRCGGRSSGRTAASDFRPKPSRLCGWCGHQALCPAFGGTPPPFPEPAEPAADGSEQL